MDFSEIVHDARIAEFFRLVLGKSQPSGQCVSVLLNPGDVVPRGIVFRFTGNGQHVNRFKARITVTKERSRVDGKSILGLLTLAARQGTTLRLVAEGEDEVQVLAELQALVRDRFGESC